MSTSRGTVDSPFQQRVAHLMDNLKSEEMGARAEAAAHIHPIALALGPERSRIELVPFIKQSLLGEEDEVQSALALHLNSEFISLLGGWDYLTDVVPLHESLLSSEEASIRNDCVTALRSIMQDPSCPSALLSQLYFPVFERLSASDEWFTKKSSAASMAPLIITSLSVEDRDKLKNAFKYSLMSDDSPIVRRAAVSACKALFEDHSDAISDWITWLDILKSLNDDPQDSVRLLLVEPIALIGQRLPVEVQRSVIFPLAIQLIGDNSWRVRYMAAQSYSGLMRGIGLPVKDFDPLLAFSGLLGDHEAEVRISAAGQIASVTSLLASSGTISTGLLKTLQNSVSDSNSAVRAALALQLNDLSAVVGQATTMSDLLPLFLQLFQDDSPQVRLNVISRLDVINRVIGVEHLSQALLPAIVKLTEDKLWTVRRAVIEYIPVVSEHLGMNFFDQELLKISVSLLDDPVYVVRQAAISMMKRIGEIFGPDHFSAKILPEIQKFSEHSNYLRRMTFLMAVTQCSDTIKRIDGSKWRSLLERMAGDSIANVRLNVAKTAKLLPGTEKILERLKQDQDEDVCFYAKS